MDKYNDQMLKYQNWTNKSQGLMPKIMIKNNRSISYAKRYNMAKYKLEISNKDTDTSNSNY